MKHPQYLLPRAPVALSALACAAMLAACGGGGDDTPSAPPGSPASPPAAMSWQGHVFIDKAIEKAIVCVDLNANGACDGAEPASSATDAAGTYSLSYQPSTQEAADQARKAPLLAQIGTDAVDALEPGISATKKAFVLMAPSEKHAQINPLTTLVQANVARGQTSLQNAEQAVALQLGITVAEIYDYQAAPASSVVVLGDNARTSAKLVAFGLEQGSAVSAPVPSDTAQAYVQLARLEYTDANNYRIHTRESSGVANAQGLVTIQEIRSGKTGGVDRTEAQLYPTQPNANSLQLTAQGWQSCSAKVARLTTQGTPSRSSNCATLYYSVNLPAENIAAQSMADVITRMQSGSKVLNDNEIPFAGTSVLMATSLLGNQVFPQGARLSTSVSIQLNQPRIINDTTFDSMGAATLESLIAGRPSSNVVTSTAAGTIGGLGWYSVSGSQQQIRAAFIDSSRMAFYRCEVDASMRNPKNCVWMQDGTYAITTLHGVRFLEIQGSPNTQTLRGYTEYQGLVYTYGQDKPFTKDEQALSYTQRLNETAWNALRGAVSF